VSRTRTALLSLSAVAALAVGVTACNETEVSTKPKAAADSGSDTKGEQSAAPAADEKKSTATKSDDKKAKQDAKVGDTIPLKGYDKSEAVDVALLKVVDPAEGEDKYTKPKDGKRFVAVQFKVTNTGSAPYDSSPGSGAKLVDAEGQSFDSTYAETSAGPRFASGTAFVTGDSGLGYVTFEIPEASKVAKIQFGLNSGYSNNKGQWNIG
jgi:hypothetical protein